MADQFGNSMVSSASTVLLESIAAILPSLLRNVRLLSEAKAEKGSIDEMLLVTMLPILLK